MASRQTDFSGEGYLNVRPNPETATQKDITYPTPQDPQPPDIPAHFEKNSQAIANNMNYVYKLLHNITGIDPGDENADINDITEKVNVPLTDDQENYGQDGQGLASTGTDTNETKWVNFATVEDINKPGVQTEPNTICMWYGAVEDIPQGWVLCDGTKGTPDMKGRVPVGADAPDDGTLVNLAKGDKAGAKNHTLNSAQTWHRATEGTVNGNDFNVSGSGTLGTTYPIDTVWVSAGGNHTHTYQGTDKNCARGDKTVSKVFIGVGGATSYAGHHNHSMNHYHHVGSHAHNANHSHTFTGQAALGATPHNNTQPSVGVHFIMFKGGS